MSDKLIQEEDTDRVSRPKVSIIMPLFNHECYVKEAIDSVLKQSFPDFELIIINDGSTDDSEHIVISIKDDRIRYFHQENRGASVAINRGIHLAQGAYTGILNSDDVYDSKRIEECVRMLESDNSLSAVFSSLEFIDEKGDFIKYFRGPEENWLSHDETTSFKGDNNILLDLLAGNFIVTTSNLFCRKKVFDEIGYFSNLKYAHDYEFFLRLCYRFEVYPIERPLVKYRIHSMNTVKESEAAVSFEVGLVLSNFFLHYDLRHLFENEDEIYSTMAKFLNSLNTYDTDRMILTLLLFGMIYPDVKNRFFPRLLEQFGSPFRRASIDRFKKSIDGWSRWQETNERLVAKEKELNEVWRQLQETNERLVAKEKELSDGWSRWQETNERLVAKEKELSDGWSRWQETNGQLQETNERLATINHTFIAVNDWLRGKYNSMRSLQHSRWFRLIRYLLRPFHKLFGRD